MQQSHTIHHGDTKMKLIKFNAFDKYIVASEDGEQIFRSAGRLFCDSIEELVNLLIAKEFTIEHSVFRLSLYEYDHEVIAEFELDDDLLDVFVEYLI